MQLLMSNAADEKQDQQPQAGLRTRISASWTGVVVAACILVLLVVFIAQNTHRSSVNFLWFHGTAPTAVVLLIAAAAGALVVIIVAVARILQLRRAASHPET
jgi:putative membrane protein